MHSSLALIPNDGSDEKVRVKVKVTFEISAQESVQHRRPLHVQPSVDRLVFVLFYIRTHTRFVFNFQLQELNRVHGKYNP